MKETAARPKENFMSDGRKRGREEEEAEFAPLSKRINNLHLHNYQNGATQQQQQLAVHQSPYSPDLTEAENPHYFRKNKLLFELHLERGRRGPPPT